MDDLPLFNDRFWTVTDITGFIKGLLENTPPLQDCWVRGEVSNFSSPVSGHIYFTLKDSGAILRCVAWKPVSYRIKNLIKEGGQVDAHGRISLYPPSGQHQLVVDAIQPVGEGQLYQEFLRMKEMFSAEGLFDPERKRQLPQRPSRIGLVTSPTGAALQDMLNTIRRRYPLAEVILSTTSVQGVEAPGQIVQALLRVVQRGNPDVVIVARGGGSFEDLWAFNDERVVRAIAGLPVPVITGIGHETDITLADFAADARAPTPTAAAELATPDTGELVSYMAGMRKYLFDTVLQQVSGMRRDLYTFELRLKAASPAGLLQVRQQSLDGMTERMQRSIRHQLEILQLSSGSLAARLAGVSPDAVVSRGYAIVTGADDGRVISSTRQVDKGDRINIRVRDGSIHAVAGDN